jgi:hypothetical protein
MGWQLGRAKTGLPAFFILKGLMKNFISSLAFALVVSLATLTTLEKCGQSQAAGRHAPTPVVEASPSPSPSVSPMPTPSASPAKTFVTLGKNIGSNVDLAFAAKTLAYMNLAYRNGCLESTIVGHHFRSLNSVFTPGVSTSKAAAAVYLGGAPYALDLRWYSKWASKVIGYTYNFVNDDWDGGKSETRIWTNTNKLGDEKMYASHLAHELSHQARTGGFVHYTIFGGSFPYDVGDIMAMCVLEL